MRFDKLTIKGQEALSEAQSLATSRGHSQITPGHLLRALLDQPEGSSIPILQKIGVPLDNLLGRVEEALAQLPKVSGGAQPSLSPATSRALEAAFVEAEARGDEYVSTEHVLLAIAREKDDPAAQALAAAGATPDAIQKGVESVRGGSRRGDPARGAGALAPHQEQPGVDR
jgi:ATP-dependent Clp protease ATP-binding subunit ClpB